jgi:hypothetical protein
MSKKDNEIAELKARMAELEKAAKPVRMPTDAEVAAFRDEMHQLRERRMSHFSAFSREDLAAMEAACSTSDIRDLVAHGTIRGPSADGVSGTVVKVSANAGLGGTGWVEPAPIRPPPGVALADRLVDEQDRKDREALIAERRGR